MLLKNTFKLTMFKLTMFKLTMFKLASLIKGCLFWLNFS